MLNLYTKENLGQPGLSFHGVLNRALHSRDRSAVVTFLPYLRLFLDAAGQLPNAGPCKLWRGLKQQPAGGEEGFAIGSFIHWWGISSATRNARVLANPRFFGSTGARTLFSLECINGVEISMYSDYPEEEVLLLPGARFQVEQTMPPEITSGVLQIVLKQVACRHDLLNFTAPDATTSAPAAEVHPSAPPPEALAAATSTPAAERQPSAPPPEALAAATSTPAAERQPSAPPPEALTTATSTPAAAPSPPVPALAANGEFPSNLEAEIELEPHTEPQDSQVDSDARLASTLQASFDAESAAAEMLLPAVQAVQADPAAEDREDTDSDSTGWESGSSNRLAGPTCQNTEAAELFAAPSTTGPATYPAVDEGLVISGFPPHAAEANGQYSYADMHDGRP